MLSFQLYFTLLRFLPVIFDDTVSTEDCNPLGDPGSIDEKVYVSGIGLAIDEDAVLVSFKKGL